MGRRVTLCRSLIWSSEAVQANACDAVYQTGKATTKYINNSRICIDCDSNSQIFHWFFFDIISRIYSWRATISSITGRVPTMHSE